MNRRDFVKSAGILVASGSVAPGSAGFLMQDTKTIRILKTDSNFEREKLVRPFGFKGGFLTELWQIVSKVQSDSGINAIGIGTQSVLYGDPDIFVAHSEAGGNALMYALTDSALQIAKTAPFKTPIDLLDRILPDVMAAAKKLAGKAEVNVNFLYNALVSVDNAAWLLYAAENKLKDFDSMIPGPYKKALGYHNDKIAVMYQVPYGMPMSDLTQAVKKGYFVIKIKTGFPGTQEQMLKGDIDRLTEIHNTLKNVRTPHTGNGRLIYTIDANARYEKKETVQRYLDHANKIGAFDQIMLYEEPLSEYNDEDVSDLGIRVGADESVHHEKDALRRLQQGYTAFVLKGIAKTLSQSMKIAKLAHEHNVPCMCADLTVNPILIDWHKNLAARLAPFPGIGMGMMETNGDMNYINWDQMVDYHPAAEASWTKVKDGVFQLNSEFYKRSGGIFEPSEHYQEMFGK